MDVNNVGTNESNNAGWAVAVILLLLVLFGAYFAFGRTASVNPTPNTTGAVQTDTTPGSDTTGGAVGGSVSGSASGAIDVSGGGSMDDTGDSSGM